MSLKPARGKRFGRLFIGTFEREPLDWDELGPRDSYWVSIQTTKHAGFYAASVGGSHESGSVAKSRDIVGDTSEAAFWAVKRLKACEAHDA